MHKIGDCSFDFNDPEATSLAQLKARGLGLDYFIAYGEEERLILTIPDVVAQVRAFVLSL